MANYTQGSLSTEEYFSGFVGPQISKNVFDAHCKSFVTFIDDYSRFSYVYFVRSKGGVFFVFKTFLAFVETQFSTSIKVLQSDFEEEYISTEFWKFLQSKGIISQLLSFHAATKLCC